jgi:riboflavin synthase
LGLRALKPPGDSAVDDETALRGSWPATSMDEQQLTGGLMFTGIIESVGSVAAVQSAGAGKRMTVHTDLDLSRTRIGDSIAVNGACLTAVALEKNRFAVDISPESLKRTTLGQLTIGQEVNLERALRLSDRIDGHLVSGHIDGIGHISSRNTDGNAIVIGFSVPSSLSRYMIEKGSVAIDGISLTVNSVAKEAFSVSIIPHTAEMTTLKSKSAGDAVNIETDMIGKYVAKFMIGVNMGDPEHADGPSGIDMEFLAKTGFI